MALHQQRIAIGALLVGVLIGTLLYGVATLQVFIYYLVYRDDKKGLKFLVATIWLLDIVSQILVCMNFYYYAVTHRHDFNIVSNTELPAVLIVGTLVNCFLTSLVQAFFTYRLWLLSYKSRALAFVSITLNLAGLVMGIVFAVEGLQDLTFRTMHRTASLLSATMATNAACDIILTGALLTILQVRRCNAARNNNVVTRIMIYSLNTGLLTSITALGATVVLVRFRNQGLSMAFYAVLGRLYSNSLLANLNARQIFRNQIKHEVDVDDVTIPNLRSGATLAASQVSSSHPLSGDPQPPSPTEYKGSARSWLGFKMRETQVSESQVSQSGSSDAEASPA
ncbi:hypothetical protein DENSPDRAFT_150750 [Dentipellis sp. KUC8613]|nr:hypothetical protein DENSPDRAFT_150750 [Dentipellis sp. KUC8613]